jgi:trimethylamine--corrinoid protein Co-methyltransferase
VELIIGEAFRVLEEVGILVENEEALGLLSQAGARVSDDRRRVFIPQDMCERCIESVPRSFSLYDRHGGETVRVGGDDVHFVPGSVATRVYDFAERSIRKATTQDVVEFVALMDGLPAIDLQSTCVVPDDVPESVADRYRLFLALAYGNKPVVTGTFTKGAFSTMLAFLTVARGTLEALKEKPLAIFDCCPSSPLMWSDLTGQVLIDCARSGVPVDVIPAPLIGATSPVTLMGTLIQHTAENLSGIVIHQTAGQGSPLAYGGAAAVFDMRKGTAPMSGIEAVMVDAAYAQIGKFFGLPTHSFMGLSDAKTPDIQAGFETTLGTVLATLAGVNIVSGAGLLNYVNCQSLEKLVIDNEICAHAQRLVQGIRLRGEDAGFDVIRECALSSSFLTSQHTRQHFREEVYYPDPVIDRLSQGDWEAAGGASAADRAHDRVRQMLESPAVSPLDSTKMKELEALMASDAAGAGMEKLPEWRLF